MNTDKCIVAEDGIKLHFQFSKPTNNASLENSCLIILVHGFSEHSGLYAEQATFLNNKGFFVARYDQRGFGKSDSYCKSEKGRATLNPENPDELANDLNLVVQKAKSLCPKNIKSFLFGHSLGAWTVERYSVLYEMDANSTIDGVIITGISDGMPFPLNTFWGKALVSMLNTCNSQLVVGSIKAEELTNDSKHLELLKEDELWQSCKNIRVCYIKTLLDHSIKFPNDRLTHNNVLAMNGEMDAYDHPSTFHQAVEKIVSPNITSHIISNCQHNVIHDPKQEGLKLMLGWIEQVKLLNELRNN